VAEFDWSPTRDSGSATVIGCALICVCLVVGVVAVAFGELAAARARVSSAADMAALAGAEHVVSGDPCAAADRVARRGDARLASCEANGEDVVVTVWGDVPDLVARIIAMSGADPPKILVRSRAGPPP